MSEDSQRFGEYSVDQVLTAIGREDLREVIAYQSDENLSAEDFVAHPFPQSVMEKHDGILPEFRANVTEFSENTEERIATDGLIKEIIKLQQRRLREEEAKRIKEALRVRRTTIAAQIALEASMVATEAPRQPYVHHGHTLQRLSRNSRRTPSAA